MDPIAISGLLVIVILLAAAAFGIYNRKKGAPVSIKIDPVKRAERQAKRKARRQEIIEGVKAGLGELDEAERAEIQAEILEAGQALVSLAGQVAAGKVDPVAALKAAQEIGDVMKAVREGIED